MPNRRYLLPLFLLLILALSFVVLPLAYATDPMWEYFNTGDDTAVNIIAAQWQGQTFTTNATAHNVTSIKVRLFKVGTVPSPTTVTLMVRNCNQTDHKPTGGDLTSGTLDGSTFTTSTAGAWYEFIVTSYALTVSHEYAIIIKAPSLSGGNYISWRTDSTGGGGYAGGTCVYTGDSGSTWTTAALDDMFEVHGVATTVLQYSFNVTSAHDTPNPTAGSHLYNNNTSVTASVDLYTSDGGYQWICTGYTGTGSCGSGAGYTVTFSITQNSTITWNWALTALAYNSTNDAWTTSGNTTSTTLTCVAGDYILAMWMQENSTATKDRPDLATVTPSLTGGTLTLIHKGGAQTHAFGAYSALYGGFTTTKGTVTVSFTFSGDYNHPFSNAANPMLLVASNYRGVDQANPFYGNSSTGSGDVGTTSPFNMALTVTPTTSKDGQLYVAYFAPQIYADQFLYYPDLVYHSAGETCPFNDVKNTTGVNPATHYGVALDYIQSNLTSYVMDTTFNFTYSFLNNNPMWTANGIALNPQAGAATTTLIMETPSPPAGGTVVPTVGNHTYAVTDTVNLTATANGNYTFWKWVIDANIYTDNPHNLSMSSSHDATAYFNSTLTYLTMETPVPSGGGTVNPSIGVHAYNNTDTVNVTATANGNFTFWKWVIGANTYFDNPHNLSMSIDRDATAYFNSTLTYLTITAPSGSGTTTPATGVDYPYNNTDNANMTAYPSAGWQFLNWVIDSSVNFTFNPLYLAMSANHTGYAVFVQNTVTLTMNPTSGGTVTPTVGNHTYTRYVNVTLTATNATGFYFVNWTINGADYTANPYTLNMTADMTVTAHFATTYCYVYIQNSVPVAGGSIHFSEGVTWTDGGVYALVPYGHQVTFTVSTNSGWTYEHMLIGDVNGTQIGTTTAGVWKYTVTQSISVVATFYPVQSGGVDWSTAIMMSLVVPLLILLFPALVLMAFLGAWGFYAGLGLMLVIGTFLGLIPFWLIIVMAMALAVLLYERRREGSIGI